MRSPPLPAVVLLPLSACTGPGPGTPPALDGPRVVAIADLHGDLAQAQVALRLAGLVDAEGYWSGGATTLVQTGDMLDRGDQGRELLALFQRLQGEASAAGGRVEVLLGNHEVMNLLGDWRGVSAGDLASWGGEAARQEAFGPGGEVGVWLRARPVAVAFQGTVFVHGGLTPALAQGGLDALNNRFWTALAGGGEDALLGPEGPNWYRGYLQGGEGEVCPVLREALVVLGAERMVVGHTTHRGGRIVARCQGALLGIDVGLAAYAGAHMAVLELRGEDAWALYPAGPENLPDPYP